MGYSVAMCTYNGEKYIKQQIDSILEQTIKPNEIVVCDDGSTDKTKDILDNYKEKYPDIFRIYYNKENLRSVKNFEKSISLCTQDFIFLSDQDDIWVENKAEIMLKYFEDNPNIDALATNGYCIDEEGKVHEKYSLWDIPMLLRSKGVEINYFEIIAYIYNVATGASMAFRSKIREEIMPFPIIKDYHHDEWIATITSKNGRFELLYEKLFYYRTHEEQQVGGVFFDKKKKNRLLNTFEIRTKNNFFSYKNILKRLSISYRKFMKLNEVVDNKIIYDVPREIKSKYNILKQNFVKDYPISSRLLFFVDKIKNKRQI